MAQRSARMKQGLASMETMTVAVTELYGVLTPEQKALADKQFARGGRGGEHGHHRMS
jgi:Spy/CpxP family protein refolding chaperone